MSIVRCELALASVLTHNIVIPVIDRSPPIQSIFASISARENPSTRVWLCGRYVMARAIGDLVADSGALEPDEELVLTPNWNVAPTQSAG